MNFARLEALVPHIMDKRYRHATLTADGFMDLTVEWIGSNRLAMAHYGEQNGDSMADPDMELIVDFDNKTIMPATYQNDYAGVYQEVYLENNRWRPKLSRELTSFLNTWLRNIEFQGHVPTKAIYYDPDKESQTILFDEQGREYGFDIPHDLLSMSKLEDVDSQQAEKEEAEEKPDAGYELGFGVLGNGTTVWNRLHEVNGDYETIAHISDDGEIKYYRDDLPAEVAHRIENRARLQSSQSPPEPQTEAAVPQAESEQPSAFSLSQTDVDRILRTGSNEDNSLLRICAIYRLGKSAEDIVEFLRHEYRGGKGLYLNNEKISVWFNNDGIHIAEGDTALFADAKQLITWEQAEQRIGELLEQGQYMTQDDLNAVDLFERTRLAETLWYVHGDMSDEVRHLFFSDDMFHGGFPDSTARIAEMLAHPEMLDAITNELERFAQDYEQNRDLMRFHHHNPRELLDNLRDLRLPRREYASELTDVPYLKMFITQDEADAALISGSGVSGGKRRIYAFFAQEHTYKEKADFLKKEYGTGGRSHALSGASHSWEEHDSKGIEYRRSRDDDSLRLTWNATARRIDYLIGNERYLTGAERAQLAEQQPVHAEHDVMDDVDPAVIREQLNNPERQAEIDRFLDAAEKIAQESAVEPYERFAVVETEDGYAIWDDLDDGYYVDEEGVTEEFTSEWQANAYLDKVKKAVADKEAEEWLYVEHSKNGIAEPKPLPYKVGDTVYLEDNRPFVIDKIGMFDVSLRDPSLTYPIARAESRESFARLLEQYPQPDTTKPERINYHITDDNLGVGGVKEKYQRNVAAINLLKQIEDENRLATADEQEVLAQYVGWGGLAKAFDETDSSWSGEYAELKSLLDETEYRSARASTLNAHYTSPVVIKAMYKALENMGFTGGNVLEPAMGIGNFMGMLPPSLSDSKMYGVELDSISGRIAQQLYQRESIQVTGFEHTAFQDNFFDVTIGNIPFGSYGVADKKYDKYNFLIHDYFMAKCIDKVRPGGIVALITSKGTLDKKNSNVRKYLAQRTELVGAVRLPNNTFKANAGTDVTSDILFLKKRDSLQDIEPGWVQLGQTPDGVPINQYYIDNPHMVLGKMEFWKGMYGNENETACVPLENADLHQQLDEAISYIEAEIDDGYMMDEPDAYDTSIPADPDVKNYSFTVVDDKLYYRENSRMNLYETNATAEKRIRAMITLSTTLHTLIDYQLEGYGDFEIRKMQQRLNSQYDNFVKAFGRINDRANRLAFSDDSTYYLLSSLENLDEYGEFIGKADIFTKQTIRSRKQVTHVDIAAEALALSMGNKAKVDIGYMSALTGKEPQTIINDLTGVIFKDPLSDLSNPYEGFLTADEYLSGNVRDKLRTAKLTAESHPELAHHIPALEAVQPKDLEAGDIEVRLGTVWIPTDYIQDFMFELLDTSYYSQRSIEVEYSKHSGSWYISNKSMDGGSIAARETYGTRRINAYQIIEETLNQKSVRITDKVVQPDGKEEYVLNKKETFLATQKQNLIKEAFKDWIFKDEQRRKHLVDYYNANFNNIRPREYNGDHLVFEGMNPTIELHPHQRNAIARQLYGGNTLLAHVVGAGKSFTMIAAAMEAKRLGLSTKSMITVPNHLTEQIAAETLRLYPSAKVLVTTKKDFQKHNRKRFCSKIATGDYDIIVIGHSQYEKVSLSTERQIRTIEREIFDITNAISSERRYGAVSFNVKQMERTKKSLELMLERLNDQSRKDDVVTFEELGVDRLFVDEAHNHKNLFVYTKMRNVAGVQQTQAQKAMDMYMKCKYIDEITGGKGITFSTGTPVSNSMVEMFTMQRYLQMHELEMRDLHHFDNWASVFGETQTAYELAPEGDRFRIKTRFSRFHNLPELMAMFKEVADVQTNDMLDLPIPKLKGGKIQNISVKATDIQRKMIAELGERADVIRNGDVDPTEDNMLKVTNDGRKIALDQRLANVCLPDEPNSKVNTLMRNVYDIWERETENKGTQIVFCDLSTPKFNGEFNVYEDLKKKWLEKGIPEQQIAFIHEAKNEKQKAAMFAKVRSGDIRIILGSTFMMGSGVNIQDRLKAVHHADVGWKPSSMEQRNGRILRQGNMYEEVEIYRYITENTFDSYSWQLLEQKQRFISQIMTSKAPVRSADDIDESVLSYAEVKALATGNPLIKERMELDVEVGRLKMLKAEHKNQTYRLQDQISTRLPEKINATELRIKGFEADIQTAASFFSDDFEMTLNGEAYDDKKKAGEMILAFAKQVHQLGGKTIGKYNGFDMAINADSLFRIEPYIEIKGELTHRVYLGDDAHGNITRLDNAIKGFSEQLERHRHDLDASKVQLEKAKEEVDKPFAQEFELRQKTARLNELNHELSLNKNDETMEIDEGEQPEAGNIVKEMER